MLLTKLLPHAVDWRALHGHQELSASDIAAALGSAEGVQADTIRMFVCYEVPAGRRTLTKLQERLESHRMAWHKPQLHLHGLDHSAAQRASKTILWAWLVPDLCAACNGNGGRIKDDQFKRCQSCRGSGVQAMSEVVLAGLTEVSMEAWRRHYREQFLDGLAALQKWARQGAASVRWNLLTTQ